MKRHMEKAITVENGANVSAGFTLIKNYPFMGALFPAMDDGNIGLGVSFDKGSNYYPVIDNQDGNDVVLCGSGDDPGYVDFTDFVRALPVNEDTLLRFTCAAQSSGAVTIRVFFAG